VGEDERTERLILNAGALKVTGTRGDAPIDPNRLSLSIYVSDRNNPQAKLIYSKAKAGDLLGLPEGAYHIVSTYLDLVGIGSLGVGRAGGGGAANAVETN